MYTIVSILGIEIGNFLFLILFTYFKEIYTSIPCDQSIKIVVTYLKPKYHKVYSFSLILRFSSREAKYLR